MKKFFQKIVLIALFLPLNLGAADSIKDDLIGLLDQIVMAKRYWIKLSHNPVTRALTRPLSLWVKTTWKEEIAERLTVLDQLEKTVAQHLGKILSAQPLSFDTLEALRQETTITLKKNGIPPHLSRHWLSYSCAALIGALVTWKIKKTLENEKLITFSGSKQQYQAVFSHLSEQNPPFRFHGTTNGNNIHYFRIDLPQVHLAQEALAQERVNAATINERMPTITDTILNFYDKEGSNKLWIFFNNHLIDPLQSLYFKILKQPVKQNILSTNNTQDLVEDMKRYLEDLAQKALEEKNYDEFFTQFELATGKLNSERTLDQLRKLRGAISAKASNTPYSTAWKTLTGGSAGFSALLSRLVELNLQVTEVADNVGTMIEKQELVIELVAMMPAALLGWLGYTGVKNFTNQRYHKHIITPLKDDLYDFKVLLDEYQYEKTPDLAFFGMRAYWINKLQDYTERIATEHRMHFARDLERLASNISVRHQKSIVTALLYYGVPSF